MQKWRERAEMERACRNGESVQNYRESASRGEWSVYVQMYVLSVCFKCLGIVVCVWNFVYLYINKSRKLSALFVYVYTFPYMHVIPPNLRNCNLYNQIAIMWNLYL